MITTYNRTTIALFHQDYMQSVDQNSM